MSQGQGSISRTSPSGGAQPPFVNIAGARNGASLDSSSYVVLGQDVGEFGDPAALLNSREIPMVGGFRINWFGGCSVMSTVECDTPAAQLLELQGMMEAANAIDFMNIAADSTVVGSVPTMLAFTATTPLPFTIATPGAYMRCDINGVNSFFMGYNGETFYRNPVTGNSYFAIQDGVELLGAAGQPVLQIQPTYNTSIPAGILNDLTMKGVFTAAGGSLGLTNVLIAPTIDQTAGGTGNMTGILFDPAITSLTGELIAFQNTIGDVKLQSNATTGRTGIHNNSTLSAWLHIGPGAIAAGSGPLKLTAGPLLTVPEDGCIEYDGTNFYKTIGVTRSIIV